MFTQVLAVLFYALEYQKLNFANPAFIAFWLYESVAYLVLSYTASLNLGTNVRINSYSGSAAPVSASACARPVSTIELSRESLEVVSFTTATAPMRSHSRDSEGEKERERAMCTTK